MSDNESNVDEDQDDERENFGRDEFSMMSKSGADYVNKRGWA